MKFQYIHTLHCYLHIELKISTFQVILYELYYMKHSKYKAVILLCLSQLCFDTIQNEIKIIHTGLEVKSKNRESGTK